MNEEYNNPEEYFEEFSSRILTFISHYRQEVLSNVYSDNRFEKVEEKFFYTIIQKTLNSFDAANIFIRNFDSSRDFQTSLYIIIRAILNDIIVSEYIIIQSKNSEEKRTELINQINFDHISYILSSLKIERKARKLSESEVQKEIKDLKISFPQYFNDDGTEKIAPLRASIQKFVSTILDKPGDERSHELISTAYILYIVHFQNSNIMENLVSSQFMLFIMIQNKKRQLITFLMLSELLLLH